MTYRRTVGSIFIRRNKSTHMSTGEHSTNQPTVGLPRHLFLFSAVGGLLIPFLARFLSVSVRGWDWFTDYLPGVGGVVFFSAFNLIPSGALYGLGKGSKRAPVAFWFALAAGVGFLLWAHGTVNLRSSSTAAIALLFIPIYAAGAVVAGWAVGLLAHAVVRAERGRAWLARIVGTAAVVFGAGTAINESSSVAEREARFPVVAVNKVQLSKRQAYTCCSLGRVEVLALDNFDAEPGKEIAVLGVSGIALLKPVEYAVKSKSDFAHDACDGCVHMYPYLVPNGKGSLLVASSDGVADSRGHLLWALKASGFTRLVPIQLSAPGPTFLAYHNNERVDLHNTDGKVLWSVKLAVSNIGAYVAQDGERLPFAITAYGKSREFKLYDLSGNLRRTIPLPEWASSVEAVAWPKPGHLLVGSGSWISVLDLDGKEVLRHVIQGTSFNPYHGPEGTAVRFSPPQEPYLAAMSHGSSGYTRSVLLLFDPKGRLVWQEEVNKLRTILAVPRTDGKGEVLLVGGMDGVIEYRLAETSIPNPQLEKGTARSAPLN